MSDTMFRKLLGLPLHTDDPNALYREGLVSSYVHRGRQALLAAHALAPREAELVAFHEQLARASELFCKAVRVAEGQSATCAVDVRVLVVGGEGVAEPLSACDELAQLSIIARLASRSAGEAACASDWLRELDVLAERIAHLLALPQQARRVSPRTGARATSRQVLPPRVARRARSAT